MTGQDEAPPTNSRATGTADFMIHSNGRIMSYNVNVNDIDKVIMANIYTKARKARMGILQ